MVKNKTIGAIIVCAIFLFPSLSFSQDYSSMPVEIQSRMDQNKVQGRDILDGIETVFAVTINLENAQSIQTLSNQLSVDETISSFNISADGKQLQAICKARVQIEDLKAYIAGVNGEIIQYTQFYRLKN